MNERRSDDDFQRDALYWLGRLMDAESDQLDLVWRALAAVDPDGALEAYVRRLWQLQQQPEFTQALMERMNRAAEAAAKEEARAVPGQRIGHYQLTELLAEGGMGQVWLAARVDGEFKHEVAIKIPSRSRLLQAQIARFERERDLLAMLSHPLIARLYDAGVTPTGQPYIVMEYVHGKAITDACDKQCLALPERLTLFLQVLDAVGFAHRYLVVHRDIKPSNVLVDAQGRVRLLDFGIAKLLPEHGMLAEPIDQTQEEQVPFTPRYAAPEQREQGPTSTATDVYSLGLLLYELLTGCLPDPAPGSDAKTRRPSTCDLDEASANCRGASASKLRGALRGDLDTIVAKAIRHDPADRYSSVDRLAEDIQRHLSSRPIVARPPSLMYRSRLFVRRHRQSMSVGAVGVGAAAVLAGTLGLQGLRTAEERTRAEALRDFMLDLVEDVDPYVGHDEAVPSTVQLLNSGVRRVRQRFGNDQQLVGELLGSFGRMYERIDQPTEAERAFEESLALLAKHAPAGDPALNKVRTLVAEEAFAKGDVERAEQLAQAALQNCTARDRECAKARAYAEFVLGSIRERQGDVPASLATFKAGVSDMELGFGPDHPETATAWCQLAVRERNAGHLREAVAAIQVANNIADAALMRAKDHAEIVRTQALIDLDAGRYRQAQAAFTAMVPNTRSRIEMAVQLRLLANAEIALGHGRAAYGAATEALAVGEAHSSAAELLFARQARALASLQVSDVQQAVSEMKEVVAGLQRLGYGPSSLVVLRARRFLAEALARQGALDQADEVLSDVLRLHEALPTPLSIEWAQALDLGGAVRRNLGRHSEAVHMHDRARGLWTANVPAEHPSLTRNALYRSLANTLNGANRDQGEAMGELAAKYGANFDSASLWTEMLRSWKAPLTCNGESKAECAFIF